ncbi:MAG: hypothetical protein A2Y80_08085 [Deltaproteobacteria bacterium RBG_13_58_19]|nr:MAG: hypothetical protein A2Y80_08085 [Deltaproteobacteria bacterium RBG_13_58_19]
MDTAAAKKGPQGYVVIHGHFYQPPRENPWIEQIEEEASALPFHDWNSRIAVECYTPNSCARIYDSQLRILDIINNYEHLSFNFGPTLISWLEAHAPLTYQRILTADRQSLARLGHGNALAQAYNHVILPLALPRDRETQVIWGLKDFEHRFRRRAESMWLPETAVDYPTLATLVEHGLKYVILSPYQARRVAPLAGGPWEPAQGQTLDTTQAYRCFLPDTTGDPAKRNYIDVFFYNGEVAADLSFGDLLKDSYRLAERLGEAFNPRLARPQILSVATDGENYGHHKKFGELALAHAIEETLPQKGFTLTNYATFLKLAPPQMKVELYLGPKGEGSSWSCAHGVGRWQENCGCATGGLPTWNQRWRAPLREAFDFLNERLSRIFLEEGQKYFRDPWGARNAYIEVLLERTPEVQAGFFAREGAPGLSQDDWVPALRLLEMQRHVLLMYTSCGWFFADLSGLETLQVLKYAARALQLGQTFTGEPLEPPFLQRLEQAVSNIPKEGNGRQVFLNRVQPSLVDFPKVVNQWAISWLKNHERVCPTHVYHFRIDPQDLEAKTQGSLVLGAGRLEITSGITQNSRDLAFFTVYLGSYLYRTQVQENLSPQDFLNLQEELFRVLTETPEDLIPLMARRLGERYYTVHDIFQDEKGKIFRDLLQPNLEEALGLISHNFEETKPLLKAMAADHLPLPRLYRALGEITLNRRLVKLLRDLEPEPTSLLTSEEILDLVQEVALLDLKLESGEGAEILSRILSRHLENLADICQKEFADRLRDFLNLIKRIPITLNLTEAQNFFFHLMEEHFPALAARAARDPDDQKLAQALVDLTESLNFSPVRYLRLLA